MLIFSSAEYRYIHRQERKYIDQQEKPCRHRYRQSADETDPHRQTDRQTVSRSLQHTYIHKYIPKKFDGACSVKKAAHEAQHPNYATTTTTTTTEERQYKF